MPGPIPDPNVWLAWWQDPDLMALLQLWLGIASVVVTLIIGTFAVWVALVQIKLAREQTALATRQGEIAEKQNGIIEDQITNRPRVELRVTGMSQLNPNSPTGLRISAQNVGKRPASGYSWKVLFPVALAHMVRFTDVNFQAIPQGVIIENFLPVDHFAGGVGSQLFVGDRIEVAWLVIAGQHQFEPFKIRWSVHGEDGRVPAEGYQEITVSYRPEGLLNVWPVVQ
jgi:hypothetical protein